MAVGIKLEEDEARFADSLGVAVLARSEGAFMDQDYLDDVEVVHRPTAPVALPVIYQVTLAYGAVFTRPEFWGGVEDQAQFPSIVSHSGEVLRPRAD
jgi:hypothetical protein